MLMIKKQFAEMSNEIWIFFFGIHLLYKRKVEFGDASLGFEYIFVHLDGKKLKIKETKPISPDSLYIIPGKGLNGCDLYIKYSINFPKELNEEQRLVLESIFPTSVRPMDESVSMSTMEMCESIPQEIKEKM